MFIDILYLFIYNILFKINIINEQQLDDIKLNFIKNSGILFIKYVQILTSTDEPYKFVSKYLFKKMKYFQDNNEYDDSTELIKNIDYIDKKPINIGSVANIYKINYQNEICVMKVLINNMKKKIKDSFHNFRKYKNIIYYIDRNFYNLFESIDSDEYYQIIITNIDLKQESFNLLKFKSILKSYSLFIIPNIYSYSDEKIIMTYEKGLKINEIEEMYPEYFEKALFLILSFLYLSFYHKIIHCDLHFSNFLFRIENNDIKMIILDFGMIKSLNDDESKLLLEILDCTSEEEIIEQISEIIQYYLNKKYHVKKYTHLKNIFKLDQNKDIFKVYNLIQIIHLLKFIYKKKNNIFHKIYFFMSENKLIDIL